MSATSDDERPARRDRLGQAFFWFHIAVVLYVIVGWAASARAALQFYLLFLPVMALQWAVNNNSCILNNIETWIRTGRWRGTPEEGQWLLLLVKRATGLRFSPAQMDAIIYGALAVLWGIAAWRYLA